MEYQCRNEEEKHKFECGPTVAKVKNELNFKDNFEGKVDS